MSSARAGSFRTTTGPSAGACARPGPTVRITARANTPAVQILSIDASLGRALSYCCVVERSRLALNLPEAAAEQQIEGTPMLGLMQDWPLLCHRIIDHAAVNHAE